jgi:hypothetical protein
MLITRARRTRRLVRELLYRDFPTIQRGWPLAESMLITGCCP